MLEKYLTEAFKSLSSLTEDVVDINDEDMESKLLDVTDNDVDDTLDVIDINANSKDELEDSYIGKIIIECDVCHSKLYKDASEVTPSEDDEDIVNVEEECPFCYSTDGYHIVGQVAPYQPEELSVEVEPVENDEAVEEGLGDAIVSGAGGATIGSGVGMALGGLPGAAIGSLAGGIAGTVHGAKMESCNKYPLKHLKRSEECYKEGFSKIELETDNDKIKVTSQPVADEPEQEVLAPIAPAKKAEINVNSKSADDAEGVDDVDIDELEEESLNSCATKYFKEQYKGSKSFKTRKIVEKNNQFIVEGILTCMSGRKHPVSMQLNPVSHNLEGSCKFEGKVRCIKESRAVKLNTNLKGSKLVVESLTCK